MPKQKPITETYLHEDQALTQDGWLTIDEFIADLTPGLREFLHKNWGYTEKDELHHPVDLFTNASVYLDVAYHVANDFIKCRHGKEH